MKLRNKKTKEVIETSEIFENALGKIRIRKDDGGSYPYEYDTLVQLNADWEDVPEEPKEYWFINDLDGKPMKCELRYCPVRDFTEWSEKRKQIGNYFETKEEAEKAVEKLKAWGRLRDRGFRFEGIKEDYTRILQSQDPFRTGKRYLQFNKSEDEDWMEENWEDLDLLFSGGEE